MTMTWCRRLVAPLVLSVLCVFAVAGPGYAPHDGDAYDGCISSFWKRNSGPWGPTMRNTSETLSGVGFVFPDSIATLRDFTLLQTLGLVGGLDPLEFAAHVLMREAVAGVLNSYHPDVAYFRDVPQHFINYVNTVLGTQSKDKYLEHASRIEAWNNRGCPLKADSPT